MQVYGQERVNTYTNNNQDTPAVTVLADCSYVIVWTSYTQDSISSYGVYGQHFTASGVPVGPEFRINITSNNGQSDASVVPVEIFYTQYGSAEDQLSRNQDTGRSRVRAKRGGLCQQ